MVTPAASLCTELCVVDAIWACCAPQCPGWPVVNIQMRTSQAVRALRARCHAFLLQQLPPDAANAAAAAAGDVAAAHVTPPDGRWGLGSFTIECGMHQPSGVRRPPYIVMQSSSHTFSPSFWDKPVCTYCAPSQARLLDDTVGHKC